MKKIILGLVMTSIGSAVKAQEFGEHMELKNEIGIDATAFFRQFFNNNGSVNDYYNPIYYVTYRRKFGSGNIRFAIGGSFSQMDIAPAFTGDLNTYESRNHGLDFRIGWEFTNNLSKKWQAFYGVDFRPSFYSSKNDVDYWNAGYANGTEYNSRTLSFAPLLGFRFKMTNKLSLTTEASFSANFLKYSSRKYYTPVNSSFPAMPDEVLKDKKRVFSSFSQPLSIILTFDI